MLRSFRVANHRSIRDEQELSLLPAYDKSRPVVPVAAIYGANASGKSNLLDALRFMQTAVRTSYASWEPGSGVPRRPFRLDPSVRVRPSLYVVDISLAGIRYSYGFTLDDERVREEWLYAYPHSRRRIIFERDGGDIQLGSTLRDHRSREATLSDLTRDNTLFLSSAARANQPEVMPVYDWFRTGLMVLRASSANLEGHAIHGRLAAGQHDREAVVGLIRAADLGIVDVQLEQTPSDLMTDARQTDDEIHEWAETVEATQSDANGLIDYARRRRHEARRRITAPELLFIQGKHGIRLTVNEQSEGTRAWMAMLAPVLEALDRGSLLLVDEIDTSLHPRLTARLVELFHAPRTNPGVAQLVFATHDASLLGTSFGREILPRDAVWFVEKDPEGATTLFPLTDFHPRKEENTERRYLGGGYGAVPSVFSDTLVEAYLAARPELADDSA